MSDMKNYMKLDDMETIHFKLTPAQLLSHLSDRTKALILPYPCNPTGGIMEKEDLEETLAEYQSKYKRVLFLLQAKQ